MTSLRKRVSSYFRQLSFHNEPRERKTNVNENSFITKYLLGQIKLKDGSPVLYGKSPNDLPNFELDNYSTGSDSVVGCSTGPNAGLTTIKRLEKHLSVTDLDIDFIDTQQEEIVSERKHKSPLRPKRPLDNSNMVIKVAGQEYKVTNRNRNRKSRSLGSLTDLTSTTTSSTESSLQPQAPAVNSNNNNNHHNNNATTTTNNNNNNNNVVSVKKLKDETKPQGTKGHNLSKSKSESNPFEHNRRKGKIIKITERPKTQQGSETSKSTQLATSDLPLEWNRETDFVYGISDSLYDTNQVTKCKNGSPIADCFGIIARSDSAILALADGVNWGEKACLAAKSAVHGSLHYLNKTIFDDTSLFEYDDKKPKIVNSKERNENQNHVTNTTEVFVSLLRAFNCAHNLILENDGMLTTLTVVVVLPLKSTGCKSADPNTESKPTRKYICCVCNVGDTLAYVYSVKCGVRELTKGSHDVYCNRDMRDALGALGPVDGINPELNNLTLSVTTVDAGDIVIIASDGLTDNYDPSVCKFTVNTPAASGVNESGHKLQPKTSQTVTATKEKQHVRATSAPIRPRRERKSSSSSTSSSKAKESSTPKINPPSNVNRLATPPTNRPIKSNDVCDNNPLVAQFLADNALPGPVVPTSIKSSHNIPVRNRNKTFNPLSKSSSASGGVFRSNTSSSGFLRSKTSVEFQAPLKLIKRNEDGLPFVTPLQKYELTLLMIEDILRNGISGKEKQCATARVLCENLLKYTVSVTAAKRHVLEDLDLYFDNKNDILVEVSQKEKKLRRKKCLEKVQSLPGKLDHVSIVAWNVGNEMFNQQQ